jgi:hypothetical protein
MKHHHLQDQPELAQAKGKYLVKDFFNISLEVFTSHEGRGRYS